MTNLHRTNLQHNAAKAVITAIVSLALVACGSFKKTVVLVPPSELPYLGQTTAPEFDGIPMVTTLDGQSHELKGPIESVELNARKRPVPVDVPFTARIDGDKLEVSTDQVRTYSLSDISYARVEYSHGKRDKPSTNNFGTNNPGTNKPSSARSNIGLALAFGSIVPLSMGVVVLAYDSGCRGIGCEVAEAAQPVVGTVLLVTGAGALVAGIIVGASSSSPSTSPKTTTIQPKLRLSPTGGTLSFEF
jgi:hypothetical protein